MHSVSAKSTSPSGQQGHQQQAMQGCSSTQSNYHHQHHQGHKTSEALSDENHSNLMVIGPRVQPIFGSPFRQTTWKKSRFAKVEFCKSRLFFIEHAKQNLQVKVEFFELAA